MRNRIIIFLCIFFSTYTWIQATNKYETISWKPLRCDSVLNIKNIQDMKIVGNNKLYITYEYPGSFGDQLLKCFAIDWANSGMSFKKEFFKRKNGTHVFNVPVTFWDLEGNMFAYERNNPYLYAVSGDTLKRNGHLSSRQNLYVPTALSLRLNTPLWTLLGSISLLAGKKRTAFKLFFDQPRRLRVLRK